MRATLESSELHERRDGLQYRRMIFRAEDGSLHVAISRSALNEGAVVELEPFGDEGEHWVKTWIEPEFRAWFDDVRKFDEDA